MADTAAPRRTQEQRAAETRGLILDATVASLIEDGYADTSTNVVQKRAGVSRGALMHHFPSKQQLLLDAIAHLTVQRAMWLSDQIAALPDGTDRVDAGIALLWQTMNGPLFAAATELWIAARTDDELRTALIDAERRLGTAAREFLADLLGAADPDDPGFRTALDHVLQTFRGAALTSILRDDARWERQLVATTTQIFRQHHAPEDRASAHARGDTAAETPDPTTSEETVT